MPNMAINPKPANGTARVGANQKQKKDASHAEAPMAGNMATTRWRRMITVKPAMQNVIKMASPLPSMLPSHEAPASITITPKSATALAISVDVPGFSPMNRKARPAVTKGTVA